MSCTHLPKAVKPVWSKSLTQLPCLVVYIKFLLVSTTTSKIGSQHLLSSTRSNAWDGIQWVPRSKQCLSLCSLNTFGKLFLASESTKRNNCRKTSPCFANYTDDDVDKWLRIFSSWKLCHLRSLDIIFVLFQMNFASLTSHTPINLPSISRPRCSNQLWSLWKELTCMRQHFNDFVHSIAPVAVSQGNPAFIFQARIRLLILLGVNHTDSNLARVS